MIWHVLLRAVLLRAGWRYIPAVFRVGGPRCGEGPLQVWWISTQAFWWLPLGCLFPGGVDMIFHICSRGCGAWRGMLGSTCHLCNTPPHTPVHLPKRFGEDQSTLIFKGSFPRGPCSSLPQVCELNPGEALSPHPSSEGPTVFGSEVGNMSPSPPQEGEPLRRL